MKILFLWTDTSLKQCPILFFVNNQAMSSETGTKLVLSELFTKQQNFRLAQIESICRLQTKCDSKIEIEVKKDGKHSGKMRKCWLPAFSPFPTMFSKALSLTLNTVPTFNTSESESFGKQ